METEVAVSQRRDRKRVFGDVEVASKCRSRAEIARNARVLLQRPRQLKPAVGIRVARDVRDQAHRAERLLEIKICNVIHALLDLVECEPRQGALRPHRQKSSAQPGLGNRRQAQELGAMSGFPAREF